MLEIMIIIAIAGTALAGLWDLFTTEIPDEIPVVMITSGIAGWFVYGITANNFNPLMWSLALGTLFLALGWIMYKAGQWGGGDAFLLGAVMYLIPVHATIDLFPLAFVINLFIVGTVYMIIYAIVLGLKNRTLWQHYKNDLKKNRAYVIGIPLLFLIVIFVPIILMVNYVTATLLTTSIILFILVTFLVFFWRYAFVIEHKLFTRRIPISKLRIGDVIKDYKQWDGVTKKQLQELKHDLKKNGKTHITIKEGVRFAPSFVLALIATLLWGNLILLLAL